MINMTNTLKWADAPSEHPFELAAISVMVWDRYIYLATAQTGRETLQRLMRSLDTRTQNTWIFAALERNMNQEALYSSHMACDQGIAKLPVCLWSAVLSTASSVVDGLVAQLYTILQKLFIKVRTTADDDDGMWLWMPSELWCLRKAIMIRWKHNYAVNYITLFSDDAILGIKWETLM